MTRILCNTLKGHTCGQDAWKKTFRSGRQIYNAQRTSANTNDLRGKILRVKPNADGSYGIPEGNLFTVDSLHRAEKQRWFSVPAGERIDFFAEEGWGWPAGTLFVKHFVLPGVAAVDEDNETQQRLETRFIIVQENGIYGATYKLPRIGMRALPRRWQCRKSYMAPWLANAIISRTTAWKILLWLI